MIQVSLPCRGDFFLFRMNWTRVVEYLLIPGRIEAKKKDWFSECYCYGGKSIRISILAGRQIVTRARF